MRLIILMLSMGSVVAYGYALAGWGIKFLGREINYQYVIGGLSGGTISAILAIWLWKLWLRKEESYLNSDAANRDVPQKDD
ncbi:MAG: hypothetical protein FWH52_03835 [Synergistaceae bacterium]|nr:hypothetical protein [Synergistaceae bacterium]